MSKRTTRFLPVLALTFILILGMTVSASAESYDYDGICTFTGGRMVSSFSNAEVAKAVENLQPGDEVTFTVEYKNLYDGSTDWYMENSIVRTLERTSAAKKHVAGTGTPEGGGYTYELIQTDSSGSTNVLFSSDRVGGENASGGEYSIINNKNKEREGLEPATNALEDWFYIDTLGKGASGKVVLHVAFDGETEVNDYMDTDGELNVRFAVELPQTATTSARAVKTGDQSRLLMWAAIGLCGGILMLILVFLSRKKDRKDAMAEAGAGSVDYGARHSRGKGGRA